MLSVAKCLCVYLRSIDFSPYGRRPLVRLAQDDKPIRL